jgi:integrase
MVEIHGKDSTTPSQAVPVQPDISDGMMHGIAFDLRRIPSRRPKMLTDTHVKQARAEGKALKLTDQGGLYLYVAVSGAKGWRYDFRFLGRRQTLVIGSYPEVSLKDARARHMDARRLLDEGKNPAAAKQRDRQAKRLSASNTFEAVANAWLEEMKPHRGPGWGKSVGGWLKNHVNPKIGKQPIDAIEPSDILALVRGIAASGTAHTAESVRWTIARIYSYAIRNLLTKANPAREIRGVIQVPPTEHNPALKPKELPVFIQKIRTYPGRPESRIALQLLALTFVRKKELVGATWDEIDFEAKEWRVPASRMKMKSEHIIPLSKQALRLFKELKELTWGKKYLLPHFGNPNKHMSGETLNQAINRLGYKGKFSPHGIRSTASTILNEQGWSGDVIERQLAHKERNRIRAAYNQASYLDERRKLMQRWADICDEDPRNVVGIGKRRA